MKEDIGDLESDNFRKLWLDKLKMLKDEGCWWHYMVLKRKAKEYIRRKRE